jgi:hypothetical protein
MSDPIDRRLQATFDLYEELAAALDADQLRSSLPVASNPIGMQLWCVVGARETWARAMDDGTWGPFACSIGSFAETHQPEIMREKLSTSATALTDAAAAAEPDETRIDLKLGLLEHENQHLGQLLRYILGPGIEPPDGWKRRFNL